MLPICCLLLRQMCSDRKGMHASIDFIYKGERRKGLVLAYVMCTQEGFECDKQWNNGPNMIPVKYNHAHTYICHRNPKVTGALMEPDGRKFSFS